MIMALFSGIVARWQLALGLVAALILSHTLAYCEGRSDGRDKVMAELREQEARAKADAWQAITTEGAKGAERAREFEQQQETLRDAIEKAEAANQNALDELF